MWSRERCRQGGGEKQAVDEKVQVVAASLPRSPLAASSRMLHHLSSRRSSPPLHALLCQPASRPPNRPASDNGICPRWHHDARQTADGVGLAPRPGRARAWRRETGLSTPPFFSSHCTSSFPFGRRSDPYRTRAPVPGRACLGCIMARLRARITHTHHLGAPLTLAATMRFICRCL